MKISKILLFSMLLSVSATLDAQNVMVMTVEGSKQGLFKTESTTKLNKTELTGYSFELTTPRDVATGMASGKRTHHPVIVRKKTGESSPQFLQAVATNEVIKKITIEYFKQDPNGSQSLSYSIVLENASVSSLRQFMGPLNDKFQEPASSILYDEISFVYEKITVTEMKGKTTATDSR